MMRTPGLHTIKRRVAYQSRPTILPPDLFQQFNRLSFWEQDFNTKAHRIDRLCKRGKGFS